MVTFATGIRTESVQNSHSGSY